MIKSLELIEARISDAGILLNAFATLISQEAKVKEEIEDGDAINLPIYACASLEQNIELMSESIAEELNTARCHIDDIKKKLQKAGIS